MEKRLDHIVITFENCENVTIPKQYILSLQIPNATVQRVYRHGVIWCEYYGSVDLKLTSEIDTNCYVSPKGGWDHEECTVTQRIEKWDDIVYIDLVYEDGSSECLRVPWEDADKDSNSNYQTSFWAEGNKDYYYISIDESNNPKS